MPQGDKTGPQGLGSRTGRGLGDCPEDKETKDKTGRPRLGLRGAGRQGQGRRGWFGRFRSNRNKDA